MIYVSHKLLVQESFSSLMKEKFLASSKMVNFDEPEPVRKEINAAVERETNAKIKDLIAPSKENYLILLLIEN